MNKLDALELSKKLNNMVITSSEFTKAYDGITSCSAQTKAYQKPEPYRVCRRVNILRDYPDDKTKLYPRN
ncbi:putative transposition protein [Acinetobacter baumannii]|nr:putative transposition protein [Acinetobacter baumannii]